MSDKDKQNQPDREKPPKYKRPQLTRWGTLRELTEGGGGRGKEPVTKRKTRF